MNQAFKLTLPHHSSHCFCHRKPAACHSLPSCYYQKYWRHPVLFLNYNNAADALWNVSSSSNANSSNNQSELSSRNTSAASSRESNDQFNVNSNMINQNNDNNNSRLYDGFPTSIISSRFEHGEMNRQNRSTLNSYARAISSDLSLNLDGRNEDNFDEISISSLSSRFNDIFLINEDIEDEPEDTSLEDAFRDILEIRNAYNQYESSNYVNNIEDNFAFELFDEMIHETSELNQTPNNPENVNNNNNQENIQNVSIFQDIWENNMPQMAHCVKCNVLYFCSKIDCHEAQCIGVPTNMKCDEQICNESG